MAGTSVMSRPHPGRTNREVFNEEFCRLTGTDLSSDEHELALERFYAEIFPTLGHGLQAIGGAIDAVQAALDMGLRVAIATNPIFPLSAVEARMTWAGLDSLDVHVITSYETMEATKPHGAYYTQTAAMLGVTADECLMVGDDRTLDMSAADVGMRTYYVGPTPIPACDWNGSVLELPALMKRLAL
jgi:FMN phosphatase YigB (HAD superfamily)